MPRFFVLVILIVASPALAASPRVAEGVRLYESGEFARARETLGAAVEAPATPPADRDLARMYLAAALHALGDVPRARAQLVLLARQSPKARLDPGTFLPEVVALAADARAEVQRAVAPAPTVAHQLAPEPPGLGYAFLPFGIGQYANGDPGKGTLFLLTELLAFGTSATALGLFESRKTEGEFLRWGRFDDPAGARRLMTTYQVSFWIGVALAAGGVVEALISRPSAVTAPPATAWRVRPSPLGLQVRF